MTEISNKKIKVVEEKTIIELRNELDYRIKVKREEIKERLIAARADGDLSENADYTSAREEQAANESRIDELEKTLPLMTVEQQETTGKNKKIIRMGSSLIIIEIDDQFEAIKDSEKEIKIVSSLESDPSENLISNECPLAVALLGRTVNDIVEVKGIKVPYKVKILKVKN